MSFKTKTGQLLSDALFAFVMIAADRLTKLSAVRLLKGQQSKVLIPGVLELAYVENYGAAFGVLQNARLLFIPMTLIVMCVIGWMLVRCPLDNRFFPLRAALCLVFAGAAGNLIDRLTTVYVVDFIYVSLINFPVFNVADICVTVSAACLIILGIWVYKEDDFTFLRRTG